jgi:hypothetical protein
MLPLFVGFAFVFQGRRKKLLRGREYIVGCSRLEFTVLTSFQEEMNIAQLFQSQWKDYADYHQHRTNLLLHIFAVPLFNLGSALLMFALYLASVALSLAALGCIAISMAAQSHGHKMETLPPTPFESPANAMSRLLLEQWVSFPRFVVSGGWRRNLVR